MREGLSRETTKSIYARIAQRYDFQHALLTARTDQKGRRILVEKAVRQGDDVLDCGSGTGTTGIIAARKVGPNGKVTLFDFSDAMLAVAREKVAQEGLQERVTIRSGDMAHLPFEDGRFDVVLSTYALCVLHDPEKGALEMFRVTKPGGRIAVAHSTAPQNQAVKWLAERVEDFAWRHPRLSMGCRSVSIIPALRKAGGSVVFSRHIGIPLWPFIVFVIEKPAT